MKKTLFSQYIFKLFVCKFGEKMLKFNMTDWSVISTEQLDLVSFNVYTKEFSGSISVLKTKDSDMLTIGFLGLNSEKSCICDNISEKTFIEIMFEMIEPTFKTNNTPVVGERAPADNIVANCAVFSKN